MKNVLISMIGALALTNAFAITCPNTNQLRKLEIGSPGTENCPPRQFNFTHCYISKGEEGIWTSNGVTSDHFLIPNRNAIGIAGIGYEEGVRNYKFQRRNNRDGHGVFCQYNRNGEDLLALLSPVGTTLQATNTNEWGDPLNSGDLWYRICRLGTNCNFRFQ